jgi:hypothetical protein
MTAEIDTNVAPPEKPKRTRARKQAAAPTSGKPQAYAMLADALRFILPCQKKAGTTEQQFARITNKWIVASDGILSMATPCGEDIEVCVHTIQLHDALAKCGETINVAQIETGLSVLSGPFRALIETVDDLPTWEPDANVAAIDDRVKVAIGAVLPLVVPESTNALYASVIMTAGVATGFNGAAALQALHSNDLPRMLIPRASAIALRDCKKKFVGFGFSGASATFYCEDGSIIKTQLYEDTPAPIDRLFNGVPPAVALPPEFMKAVQSAALFSKDDNVFFVNGMVCSTPDAERGATYGGMTMADGMAFNSKFIFAMEDAFQNAYFDKPNRRVYVYTNDTAKVTMRGVLMGLNVQPKTADSFDATDDDIPF